MPVNDTIDHPDSSDVSADSQSVDQSASSPSSLSYRLLDASELDAARELLSYAYPGREMEIDPETQRVAVAIEDGRIIAAAIVSSVYQVSYVAPVNRSFDLVALRDAAESALPAGSLYYSILPDQSVAADLEMTAYPDSVVAVRQVAEKKEEG